MGYHQSAFSLDPFDLPDKELEFDEAKEIGLKIERMIDHYIFKTGDFDGACDAVRGAIMLIGDLNNGR